MTIKCSKWFKDSFDSWDIDGDFIIFKNKAGFNIGEIEIETLVDRYIDDLEIDADY